MKVVIIGGVAGGASAAARLRRLDEHAQIVMIERSGYVSYANCGLPYYIGGTITDRSRLTPQTPESFRARFDIDVRVRQEAIAIDPEARTVTVRRLDDGSEYIEGYDKLILSPGAPGHAGAARRGRRAPVHAAHRRGHLPHRRLRRARAAEARHRGGRGLHRPRDGREPPRARARGDRGAARRPRPADFRCRHDGPAPQPPARARRRAPAQCQRHRLRRARRRGRHLARGRSRHRVRHGNCRAPATAARASSL